MSDDNVVYLPISFMLGRYAAKLSCYIGPETTSAIFQVQDADGVWHKMWSASGRYPGAHLDRALQTPVPSRDSSFRFRDMTEQMIFSPGAEIGPVDLADLFKNRENR